MYWEATGKRQSEAEVSCNVVNFRCLRRQNFPYIFIWIVYYACTIAFATWWTASPLTENVFSTQLRELMHSVNLISSAVFIFIIRKEWFIKASRTGAVLIILGMIAFFVIPDTRIQTLSAVISTIAMGCVNISILIPFVFLLNNTEKLYAVVGSNILIHLISLFLEYNTQVRIESVLFFAILAISLSSTLFFREHDLRENVEGVKQSKPEFHNRIYLTVFFNCIIAFICKGAAKGILNVTAVSYETHILSLYYVGGLIGCLLFTAVYAFSKKAFIWLGNITFASVAMGILCNAFAMSIPGFAFAFAVLIGIGNTVGMINMYYIIGVVGKKYNSMHYLQLSIMLIGICGGISGVLVGNLISSVGTMEISIIASAASAVVMILFMIISPVIAQTHYENDWAKDSQYSEIDNEQLNIFLKYGMSKREIEVCKLLLQGYTLRQISGILSIAYPTVNTYCTGIYRKTKINSRTELLQIFKDYTNR